MNVKNFDRMTLNFSILFIFADLVHSYVEHDSNFALVTIKQGKMRGCIKHSYFNETYFAFEGVPYARPPVKSLRFMPPKPPEKWDTEVFNATELKEVCIQRMILTHSTIIGDEDCLYLNIYSKIDETSSLKPVMVYIKTGAFEADHTQLVSNPDFIISEGVILVTVQFRLGVLGFLSKPNSIVPGNNGFKDQVMALKWINQNIASFGGDANSVTVFGTLIGGISTHLLTLSPMTKGLIHRGILIGSSALSPYATTHRNYFNRFMKQVKSCSWNTQTGNINLTIACLQNAPVNEILDSFVKMVMNLNHRSSLFEFSPVGYVIDDDNDSNSFLPEPIEILMSKSRLNQIPLIIGYAKNDGIQFLDTFLYHVRNGFQLPLPKDLQIKICTNSYRTILQEASRFYWGNETDSNTEKYIFRALDYCMDLYHLLPMYRTAKLQFAKTSQTIYFYKFSYFTELNNFYRLALIDPELKIVDSVDTLFYLFRTINTPRRFDRDSDEYIGMRRMVIYWTTFAKTGNPNPQIENSNDNSTSKKENIKAFFNNVTWKPITNETFHYLQIQPDLRLEKRPPAIERINFWEDIYKEYLLLSKFKLNKLQSCL